MMNLNLNKSVTLLELIIAIALLSLVVIGFSSIDLFSRYHVLTADRRAQVQNDLSYILEHMSKQISRAIGNERVYGSGTVINTSAIAADTAAIGIYIDYDGDGRRSGTTPPDRWIAYRFTDATGQLRYCPQCTTNPCTQCNPAWGNSANILSRKITSFVPAYNSANNYIEIQITGCWNPAASSSLENPEVTMETRIQMPSVATN